MDLIDQHTKDIMEGCKVRARDVGLKFQDETLEYIVTNRNLLELSPKMMIPTLYDYWVHDVEVLKEKGKYELYPGNPYETVINTRPPISFYNDNNPDWLNVMIFYHVLGHIDFFQNNLFFRHTWDYDFTGKALSDKRLIAKLRSEKGRWVDYIIEFARGIDNIVNYYPTLGANEVVPGTRLTPWLDYYFDVFLQDEIKVSISDYAKEVDRYNACVKDHGEGADKQFHTDTLLIYPEFEAYFEKYQRRRKRHKPDLLQYLAMHSEFLNREENRWMQSVLQLVRETSLFFQPQIRTKIMNEGWASYWHETLFLNDDRIKGHEVEFARVNSGVTSMPRVGLNPYALGMRLFYYIEKLADKGRLTYEFQKLKDIHLRREYRQGNGRGREFIFRTRETLSDFLFINSFLDQDFVDRHDLFVAGRRLDQQRMVWQYYVRSRKAGDYRRMLFNSLYHPPHITVDETKNGDGQLYLVHHFEGRPLVTEYIANTMLGIEYLWGHKVLLETSEVVPSPPTPAAPGSGREGLPPPEIKWRRVVYTMKERKLSKRTL